MSSTARTRSLPEPQETAFDRSSWISFRAAMQRTGRTYGAIRRLIDGGHIRVDEAPGCWTKLYAPDVEKFIPKVEA